MAKVILGRTPKSVPKELSFPMLDGTVGSIKADFKYRTRTQFAEFMDEMTDVLKAEAEAEMKAIKDAAKAAEAAATAAGPGAEAPPLDFGVPEKVRTAQIMERQADFIMSSLNGWNLDVDFDRAAVLQLADEVPQAVSALIKTYREAMTEGRLGN
jgi:hypothetical protein